MEERQPPLMERLVLDLALLLLLERILQRFFVMQQPLVLVVMDFILSG
jgi:hypothetical protein